MSANFADKTFLTTSLQDMSLDGNEQSASRSMPAHFTSPFRLLDVPDVGPHQPLSRIITLASSGSYKDGSSAYGTINATHEKIRKNLAPRPPPTSLMRTSKVLNALASKTWLSSGVFHLYLASWSTLDEGLLKQISGMTAVVVTLDIRAGQPHLINSGQEGRLRASEFAAKVRALVRALQVKCEKLMVRVVQGRMAGLNVAAVIVNVFRMPVQLRVKFAHIIVLLNNEENVMTPGGSIVPLLLGSKFLRKMVGDMVGESVPLHFLSYAIISQP